MPSTGGDAKGKLQIQRATGPPKIASRSTAGFWQRECKRAAEENATNAQAKEETAGTQDCAGSSCNGLESLSSLEATKDRQMAPCFGDVGCMGGGMPQTLPVRDA